MKENAARESLMNWITQCIGFADVLLALQASAAAQEIALGAGTFLQCTLEEPNFSSRTAEISEPLICYAHPLREFGRLAFPRGSYLTGHLADFRDPGRFVGRG